MSKWVMQAHFRHWNSKIFSMTWVTPQSNGFWPLKLLYEDLGIHMESIGTPTPKVGAHLRVWGFVPSHSPTPREHEMWLLVSLLTHTLTNHCLGRKPEAKVTTTKMLSQSLQRKTLNMWHKGASFYMPNSISTWSLKDFNISLNLIRPKLFNFHTWSNNYIIYTKMKKIDTVVPKWIPFWSKG